MNMNGGKTYTRAWKKGKKIFYSVFLPHGEKGSHLFAYELLTFGEIKMPLKDAKRLDIKNNSADEVPRITVKEAGEYLESRGWKWVKVKTVKEEDICD